MQADPAAERGQFDEDIVVSSLDLLVGLTECLGDGIKSLVLILHILVPVSSCSSLSVLINLEFSKD